MLPEGLGLGRPPRKVKKTRRRPALEGRRSRLKKEVVRGLPAGRATVTFATVCLPGEPSDRSDLLFKRMATNRGLRRSIAVLRPVPLPPPLLSRFA